MKDSTLKKFLTTMAFVSLMSIAHPTEADELNELGGIKENIVQPTNIAEINRVAISGHRLGNVDPSQFNPNTETKEKPFTIIDEKKESPTFNLNDVKLAIKEIKKSGKKLDIDEVENMELFNKASKNEFYKGIKKKVTDLKEDLAKKDLYVEHKGLYWSPDKNKPNSFEIGIKPTKEILSTGYTKESKNKKTEFKLDLGKESSIGFEKIIKIK